MELQAIMKWLHYYKILKHVKENRLIEVSKSLTLLECPASSIVISQGGPGDAFYIVLEGQLDITVDFVVVNSLGPGTSFGEKALENDAPRSA